jgi:methyltransferase
VSFHASSHDGDPPVTIPVLALMVVLATMLGELWLSKRNERILLARGAVAPPDRVFVTMRWAYPSVFAVMGVEGLLRAAGFGWWIGDTLRPGWWTASGAALFALAKILKYWAIATLGERWTYRVFILPGAPLVGAGPYRWMRHPNYVGVVGELIGMLLITGAWTTGPIAVAFFGWLLHQRIKAENRALGLDRMAR